MPPSDRPHILVLAAGRGRRMGGPKALMPVGGRPWHHWQSERLARLDFPATWVVSPAVARAMLAEPPPTGAPPLVTADPDAPMFASVHAGLQSLASTPPRGVFILPVDVPAPLSLDWHALAALDPVAAPRHLARRGHPLWLAWPWAAARGLTAATCPADARLDELIRADVQTLDTTDPDTVVNLNTPADVAAWLASRAVQEHSA